MIRTTRRLVATGVAVLALGGASIAGLPATPPVAAASGQSQLCRSMGSADTRALKAINGYAKTWNRAAGPFIFELLGKAPVGRWLAKAPGRLAQMRGAVHGMRAEVVLFTDPQIAGAVFPVLGVYSQQLLASTDLYHAIHRHDGPAAQAAGSRLDALAPIGQRTAQAMLNQLARYCGT